MFSLVVLDQSFTLFTACHFLLTTTSIILKHSSPTTNPLHWKQRQRGLNLRWESAVKLVPRISASGSMACKVTYWGV
ncbi:hypothetical protein F4804DRAFT_315782 [Jackrogersella minutella]|nr:hypothetical protein F4804DRAFT_315782 [Jackrogersella minutella]